APAGPMRGGRESREKRGSPPEWRSPARLLLHDPDLDLAGDFGMQADRHVVDPETLDRLVNLDAALVENDAFLAQMLGDVSGRHRAVQHVVLANLSNDGAGHRAETLRLSLGLGFFLGLKHDVAPLLALDRLQV